MKKIESTIGYFNVKIDLKNGSYLNQNREGSPKTDEKKWLVNFEKVRLGHNRVGIAWGRGFKSTIKHGSHFLWVNEGVN